MIMRLLERVLCLAGTCPCFLNAVVLDASAVKLIRGLHKILHIITLYIISSYIFLKYGKMNNLTD